MLTSRLPPTAQAPACSRYFRADSAGRIPLGRDWPALFRELARLEQVALQSRHTYARLVHLGPLPDLAWDASGTTARDESGWLHLRAQLWGEAWGRLAICDCCDSPGHVEIINARGGDILQLCPTVHTPPAEWADRLAAIAAPPGYGTPSTGKLAGFPLMPEGLRELGETVAVLPAFLRALGTEQVPVSFMLRTPEVTHLREFVPQRVTTDYPLLVATDFRTTLQLALPPVQGLALAPDHSLHLAGPGGTLLLSLRAHSDFTAAWCAAIDACFPSLA